MSTFLEILKILATGGIFSASVYFVLNKKIKQQDLKFDQMKSKFNVLLDKRSKVISALNYRVSNIEVWLRDTARLEDWEGINPEKFQQLVSEFEITLIHARFLLSSVTSSSLQDLLDELRICIDLYYEESEKLGYTSVSNSPEITFTNRLFDGKIRELMKTAVWRLSNEISNES